jgi:N-acetylglucosamine kinase-like BadF-type ATPase
MPYVLGVDGGNTKTIAIVAALDGTILGTGRAGCGDIYHAPIDGTGFLDTSEAAIANIEYAVETALQAAQVKSSDLITAVFNMAGADWPEDFALLETAMRARGYGRSSKVQNDAMGVLHAGVADNIGVSVICGTGAATGARGPDGRIWHSSMWQNQAQGGSEMSRKAFDAVIRSELGIESPTTLKGRFLDYYGLDSVEEMLHLLTGRLQHPAKRIDGLVRFLLDEAEAGDSVARNIVLEQGHALGNFAVVAARLVGLEGTPFTLVLAGGVLRHPSTLLADTIVKRVQLSSPEVRPRRSRYEPIIGVLFSALEDANVTIDDELLRRLIPTLPSSELYTTTLDHILR